MLWRAAASVTVNLAGKSSPARPPAVPDQGKHQTWECEQRPFPPSLPPYPASRAAVTLLRGMDFSEKARNAAAGSPARLWAAAAVQVATAVQVAGNST